MRYRETLVITAPSALAGSHDPVTHVFTPGGDDEELYNGSADVQDAGLAIRRDPTDQAVIQSDARAYLRKESTLATIEAKRKSGQPMTAVVTWRDGTTSQARVDRVRRLDGAVELTWMR